jgi:hypothetical protein
VPLVGLLAEAEELLRIEDKTPSEMRTGPGEGKALSKTNHHESLCWKSEVSGR